MAPRSRSRASQAASTPSATQIDALPDPVLVRCLGFLELEERQRAALVCKRFAAAACSPELLREVQLHVCDVAPVLWSLAAWLARHGRHVRKLCLMDDADVDEDCGSMASAFATCLTTTGAAGQLLDLEAGMCRPVHTEWLAAARSLQRLSLEGFPLHITPAIAGLTALQSLQLKGELQFAAGARLPASISRLVLSNCFREVDDMAPQVTQLLRLQRLRLEYSCYSSDSLSRVSALAGSLTRLDMLQVMDMPVAGVAALTRLQHLKWSVHDEADVQSLAGTLPHLTGLTCLVLWDFSGSCQLPATAVDVLLQELSGLPHLRVCYLGGLSRQAADSQAPLPRLPGGPWLRSLQSLCVGIGALLESTAVLRAATQLEHLGLLGSSAAAIDWDSPAAAALFEWLACHPPLRRVTVDDPTHTKVFATSEFFNHCMQLCRHRPALLVQWPRRGNQGQTVIQRLDTQQPF